MRKHVAWIVASVLAVSICQAISASEELRITFPHSVPGMLRYGNVLVAVSYYEDDRNRELELVWDSPDGEGGSSTTEITSENNGIPVVKDLVLSAGEYTFVATLYRSDGSKAVASQTRFVTR